MSQQLGDVITAGIEGVAFYHDGLGGWLVIVGCVAIGLLYAGRQCK